MLAASIAWQNVAATTDELAPLPSFFREFEGKILAPAFECVNSATLVAAACFTSVLKDRNSFAFR